MGEKADSKVDFSVFISGLMAEGLAAMGLLKHPLAQDIKKDMRHADMVIETLAMLKQKTSGNLSQEEDKTLEEILHQLRMGYVSVIKGEKAPSPGPEDQAQPEKNDEK